jgi:Domain of unknown function (DUF4276)
VRRLHLLVEGQTEEAIARNVIAPLFSGGESYVTWSICPTSRPAGGPAFKGGISTWAKLQPVLRNLLRDSSITVLTTLIDYYGFPKDGPGMPHRPQGSPRRRVEHVERTLSAAIGDDRFLPYLALHEIEAWVLADCAHLGEFMGDSGPATGLQRLVIQAGGPEQVNDGVDTAPSKRIMKAYPRYLKSADGPRVITAAGLPAIRAACPHTDDWLANLEARILKGTDAQTSK